MKLFRVLLGLGLGLALCLPIWASGPVDSALVYEVRSNGFSGNAGCYNSGLGGTDYSQQNSGQYSFTDLTSANGTSSSPIVASLSHSFVTADVGNCIAVNSGTNWTTGRYEIVSVSAGAATLDRAVGSASTLTAGAWIEGGALISLQGLNNNMCSGCRAWVKADATYVISSKVTFNYSNSGATWIRGYSSTRGDNGRATIQSIGSIGGDRLVDLNVSQNFTFANFTFDVNSDSGVQCLELIGQPTYIENIECKNFNAANQIVFNNTRGTGRNVWIHNGTSTGNLFYFVQDNSLCLYCTVNTIAGNGAIGFEMTGGDECLYCAVINLTGTSTIGFGFSNQEPLTLDHSLCYGVTSDCVVVSTVIQPSVITNNIFANAVNGIHNTSGTTLRNGDILNDYNFTYNMSGSAVSGLTAGAHSVTLTQTPFINPSSLDFRLNNFSGGGGLVRAHGAPATIPGLAGTFYPDGGIAQHQDPKFF